MKRLNREFFERPTVRVAQELLGKFLVRKIGPKIIKARITETEAYCGSKDLACHASKGLTERTKVMFGPAGFSYVYIIYGMYHCLNIVTERNGYPAAILIRGVEIVRSKAQNTDIHKTQIKTKNTKQKDQNVCAFCGLDFVFCLCSGSCALCFKLNGPGKLCRKLKIDRKLNGVDITKNNLIWMEDGENKIKKSQIKKGKRIGVDYAGKWKDKLWRFYLD